MKIAWETLVAAILISASILFIGRYQISAFASDGPYYRIQAVYRLDRWTGKTIDLCYQKTTRENYNSLQCPDNDPPVPNTH
jgi:hypothetical protein